MTDLIATLEGLTEPSREVDALILAWSENRSVRYEDGNLLAKSKHAPYDECVLGWIDPGKHDRNFTPQSEKQPRFTASLDAAIALVERVLPGWDYIIGHTNGGLTIYAQVGSREMYFGATPAIALCIALLRALEARDAAR